jgi:hypothetical protein
MAPFMTRAFGRWMMISECSDASDAAVTGVEGLSDGSMAAGGSGDEDAERERLVSWRD